MRLLISGPRRWNSINKDKRYSSLVDSWISAELYRLCRDSHFENVFAGTSLHLGLDTTFSSICAREGIPLEVILACDNQEMFWGEEEKKRFNLLLGKAASVKIASPGAYAEGCITKQSEMLTSWLVENPQIHTPILFLVTGRWIALNAWQAKRRKEVVNVKGTIKKFNLG